MESSWHHQAISIWGPAFKLVWHETADCRFQFVSREVVPDGPYTQPMTVIKCITRFKIILDSSVFECSARRDWISEANE
jgi:hypothetical protein